MSPELWTTYWVAQWTQVRIRGPKGPDHPWSWSMVQVPWAHLRMDQVDQSDLLLLVVTKMRICYY